MDFGDLPLFYQQVSLALARPLPGVKAQSALAIVNSDRFSVKPDHAKQAAVCAVLYPSEDQFVKLIYIQRALHDQDKHSGQISFPGGQVELADVDLLATAIRELQEETGIEISETNLLGRLSPLYIPVSNFQVHPYVFGITYKPEVLRQESEVDEIFGFELHNLLQAEIQTKRISGYGFSIDKAPFFDLGDKTLWGATAMMTNELLEVIRSIK